YAMNIGDLHSENFIVGNDKSLYIIDLEAKENLKDKSGIFDATAKGLCDEFKNKSDLMPARIVAVGTMQLVSYLITKAKILNRAEKIANLIVADRTGYIINREELHKSIVIDLLNGDVPYLTEKDGIPGRFNAKDLIK
ncbi:MAG TPA: hypothetical protein VIH61_03090, partial [Waddliaceae bacterium]